MTSWRTLVGSSDTLTVADLQGKHQTLKIERVEGGTFEGEGGKSDRKALIYFLNVEKRLGDGCKGKPFAANTTNCMLIDAMWGEDFEGWIGHWLTIGEDKVELAGPYQGDPCIRVKGSPELTETRTIPIQLNMKGGRKRKPFDKQLTVTPRQGGQQ